MFQMHMLHFQLSMSVDPELLTQHIRTQDFFYRGPTCVIKPNELAVCMPCANNNNEHMEADEHACELNTFDGWMTPNGAQSVAAYVMDNQSEKWLVLENGQSLFRFLSIAMIHEATHVKCRINPTLCFEFKNAQPEEEDDFMDYENIMDYDDDDDDVNSVDSGIYGDINRNMVYIALEPLDSLDS